MSPSTIELALLEAEQAAASEKARVLAERLAELRRAAVDHRPPSVPSPPDPEEPLDVKAAAKIIGCRPKTVYGIPEAALPRIPTPLSKRLYRRGDVESYARSRRPAEQLYDPTKVKAS